MSWVTHLAVYFVIWWLTFFMVLPFGVHSEDKVEQGNDPGAPKQSRIFLKIVINTGVAFLVWLVVFIADRYDLVTIRDFGG